jgi:nitroimidazol reductase NimA-like FMN-containing flavoprotein (pyridoxamine 5'-phosphate oxidase superfamily)
MPQSDLVALARKVIDQNRYMTLATADAAGRPWVSPVFYTPDRYTDFYWVSSPEARHSRNLAGRPDVSIVVFDSGAPIGAAQAVYMSARAEEVSERDVERDLRLYNARYEAGSFAGLRSFGPEQVQPPAPIRLYRATVSEHSVLIRGGDPERGRGVDSRLPVTLWPPSAS